MKKISTIITAFMLFAFFSCERSELELNNNEITTNKVITSCETAFGASDYCFSEDGFSRWGWVIGPLFESNDKTVHEIWAAAGQCDREKGALVGHLYVSYRNGIATVTYDAIPGFVFTETHLYVGNEMYPIKRNGSPTVAPGQFPYSEALDGPTNSVSYTVENLRNGIYVIAHAVACPFDWDYPSGN